MLKGIDKLLTGDLLKILCDMGHGDELVIADANFPAETCAQRLIRLSGIDGVRATEAILSVFPLDTYSDPAILMDMTDEDKRRMPKPEIWAKYHDAVVVEPKKIERFEFYERAKKAYAVIQTGEDRQYGNLILVKGVVL
ncbi:MAG: RbsD/FucU domain-containing protein [Clostridia bacterium]|nr:RbsD/FucU domain-containing protein [Clostridia bacterium]